MRSNQTTRNCGRAPRGYWSISRPNAWNITAMRSCCGTSGRLRSSPRRSTCYFRRSACRSSLNQPRHRLRNLARPSCLLINVCLAVLLRPFNAVDIVPVRCQNLFTQAISADIRFHVYQIDNLALRFVFIGTIQLAKFHIEPMSFEQSFQNVVRALNVLSCDANFHGTKDLCLLKPLQNREREQHKKAQNNCHVPAAHTRGQTDAETYQQDGNFFRVAYVRAKTHERRRRENSERARGAVADDHHHRRRDDGHQNLCLTDVRIATAVGHTATRPERENCCQERG